MYKRVLDCDVKQFLTADTWKDSPRIDAERPDDNEKTEAQEEETGE